jgi:large subunit ribosomal protein L21
MAFAVIETGGKQYQVSPGSLITVEKLVAEPGESIQFDTVLCYQADGASLQVGAPSLTGITVTGEIVEQFRGQKIRVFTYKPKKRQSRTLGHRQSLTTVKVISIGDVVKESKSNEKAA